MNHIYSFLAAFCVSCVLIGCLHIICPEGKLSKPIKYVLSLIFIVTVLSASRLTPSNININLPSPEFTADSYEALQISSAEYVFSYTLKANGINFEKITVCTDKLQDGSIVINKVVIISDCEKQEILNALGELAKTREVEIINE